MPFLAEQKAKATLLGDCAPTRVLMSKWWWWPPQTLRSTCSRLWSFMAAGGWAAAGSGAL